MTETIIIGKESNLSNKLCKSLGSRCNLISSRELLKDLSILEKYKDSEINIIFNNFQPATKLSELNSPRNYISNAITVTALVLEYFVNTKINKIIYTSSSSVYGNNILCKESDTLKPMSLQASLKVTNEKLIEKFCLERGIDYSIARVFNMYGGDDRFSIISKIIRAVRNQEEITLVNHGESIRDYIYIDDVVDIYCRLLQLKGSYIVNVGTGRGISIKTILAFLRERGITIKINNIEKEELKISTADVEQLCKIVGKNNFKNLEKYIEEQLS